MADDPAVREKCVLCGEMFARDDLICCSRCGDLVCEDCTAIQDADEIAKVGAFCEDCYYELDEDD